MPYDTHNRWVHGVLAEAAKTLPDLTLVRAGPKQCAAQRGVRRGYSNLALSPATGDHGF